MEMQLDTPKRYDWITTWKKALSWPNDENYIAIALDSNLRRTIVWVTIGSCINALAYTVILSIFMLGLAAMSGGTSPILRTGQFTELILLAAVMLPALAISGIIMFFIDTAIVHGMAHLMGGRGEFKAYAYIYAAMYAPLQAFIVVLPVLYLIPIIGTLIAQMISVAIGIYLTVIQINAVKATYGIGLGRAAAAVLTLRTAAAILVGLIFAAVIVASSLQ